MSDLRTFTWDFEPTSNRAWVTLYDGRRCISQYSRPPLIWATATFNGYSDTTDVILALSLVRVRDEDGDDVVEEAPIDAGVYVPRTPTRVGVLEFIINTPYPRPAERCGTFIYVLELISHGHVLRTEQSGEFVVVEVLGG